MTNTQHDILIYSILSSSFQFYQGNKKVKRSATSTIFLHQILGDKLLLGLI